VAVLHGLLPSPLVGDRRSRGARGGRRAPAGATHPRRACRAQPGPPPLPIAFSMQPIGLVRSPRTEPIDDDWGAVVSRVERDGAQLTEDSLRGLAEFSHVEIVYVFDRVDPGSVELGARRPRNNPDWPEVGAFAQRNKRRPNRIGIGTCE